jgi:hypothetical protein
MPSLDGEHMQIPLQITIRHMAPSPFVESRIRERAEALRRYFRSIMACRVAVEASTRRQRKGRLYHIRVDLTVPGCEIVVKRDPPEHRAHEAILVAVRDAFDAAPATRGPCPRIAGRYEGAP